MKKIYLIIFLYILLIRNSLAQSIIDCSSHRFDQEVFSSFDTINDVLFGSNTDYTGALTDLTLDVYQPSGDTMSQRPLIVWAHGGSFISGTKTDVDVVALSQHFAKRGYVCVSINYRLGIFPVNQANATNAVYRSVQDMKAAIRFFRQDAATINHYKIDPTRIFAGGSSAGAFAALHLAYMDQYSELPSTIDTSVLGNLEGNSGNPGYASNVNAVIDLCGALGNKTWMHSGDIPFVAMHGDNDNTVPYGTAMINVFGIPIMVVDGSHSLAEYADSIGIHNEMYTYFGADHVPFESSTLYMDTTVRFVSNFLYSYLGCTPSDPTPLPNTFTTGISSPLANNNISIYPNPSTGKFTFDFPDLKNENQLSIFDISGRKLFEKNQLLISTTVDLTDLCPGVYFYSIKNENKFYSGRLVKQD